MPNDNGANQSVATPDSTITQAVQTQVQPQDVQDGVTPGGTPASTEPAVPKWMAQLPDELKGNETLSKYQSVGEAFKSLLDGSKPGGDQEPSAPDGQYELDMSLSKDIDPTGVFHKNMSEAVKSLKLPKAQAEGVYKAFVDSYKTAEQELKTHGAEICEKELRTMWGDKYDAKLGHMKRAYGKLVPKDSPLEQGLKATLAESNPFVADLLSSIGESFSEHDPPRSSAVGKVTEHTGFLSRENEQYPWTL